MACMVPKNMISDPMHNTALWAAGRYPNGIGDERVFERIQLRRIAAAGYPAANERTTRGEDSGVNPDRHSKAAIESEIDARVDPPALVSIKAILRSPLQKMLPENVGRTLARQM